MKRAISLILIFMFLLSALPLIANAEKSSGIYTYEMKGNGTITITQFNWDQHGYGNDVFIPSMIDGYTVTGIGNGAFAVSEFDYRNSPELHIPNTIVQIGEFAFKNTPFDYISIPASVQLIGKGAFANCQNLLQFSVDANNAVYATIGGVLFNKGTKQLFSYPLAKQEMKEIKFVECNVYEIPEGILSVGPYAFYWEHKEDKYNIRGIKWPTTLKEIEEYAFYGCSVGSIPLIDKIGSDSFACATVYNPNESENSPSVVINENDTRAFQNFEVQGREGLTLTVKEAAPYAFENVKQRITLIDVESVGEGAFKSCLTIRGSFPTTIKEIGPYAFAGTTIEIETIEISSQVSEISDYSFSKGAGLGNYYSYNFRGEGEALENVIIKEGCTRIGNNAFEGRNLLSNINIPTTVTEIGANAFTDCPALRDIELPASITSIGNDAFDKANITLHVETGSYPALWAQENGYSYKYIGQSDDISWLTGSASDTPVEDTSWLH